MNKNKIFSFVMIFTVAFFCFGAFEGVARFLEERDRYVVTKEFDPLLGWKLKPGLHYVRPSGRFTPIPLEINGFGLRGADFPALPEKDEKRIMLVGDSFVFSRHFLLNETFAGLLEKKLNDKASVRTRVINAGVPGYGTGQELLFIRKLAEEFQIIPDVYVLMLFPNDILDNLSLSYGSYEELAVKPRFELNAAGKAVLKELPKNDLGSLQESFRRPAADNPWKMRTFQFIRSEVADFVASRPQILRFLMRMGIELEIPRKPGLLNGWYDERVVSSGVPLLKALINEMKEETARRGASFKVMMIPSPVQIYPVVYKKILTRQFPDDPEVKGWIENPLRPQQIVSGICKDLGIEFYDLFPVLKAQKEKSLYLSRDGHFDRDAHEIVAQTLTEWMNEPMLRLEERFNEPKIPQNFNASTHQQAAAK